ncbi:hypothetical protein AMTRI_Chr03g143750 [Amborella trichopoda]
MDICTVFFLPKNNHLLIILKYRKFFFFSQLILKCFVLFICYGVINVLTHFFIC